MTTPEKIIREDIRAISAYHVANAAGMVKLDAMENPYRLPESLREAMGRVASGAEINRYPDPTAAGLKARLRQAMAIPDGFDILLGNGSDEIIQMVAQAAARPGAAMMAPEPTFVMYRMNAVFSRLKYVGVPLREDFSFDVERFLDAMAREDPALVFIAYPNNPSGNLFSDEAVTAVIERSNGLVVLDEAYHAFAGRTFMTRLAQFPNLMVMRTVSKLGLAGLRLGYAAARPEWIREFDKLRGPYNVGTLTQALADELLSHHEALERQAAAIRSDRDRLSRRLSAMRGVVPYPSDANFILVRVPDAPRLFEGLKRRAVLVKNLHGSHPLLEHCLRLTVGTPQENDRLVSALSEALAQA